MEKRTFDEIGTHLVGTIELKERVFVTDPCYDPLTWCSKLLTNVAPGAYECFVVVTDEGSWGHRVAELHAVKDNIYDKYEDLDEVPYDIEPLDCHIGVDSGQCGIFDADYYEEHQSDDDYDDLNSWYRRVCNLTYNAGVIDGLGVASESGYGDGGYNLWVAKEGDKVVAMKVKFIGYPEDEED